MKKYLLLLLFVCSTAHASYIGSYGLYNYQGTNYEVTQANREVRSIASITKLFTANTILQSGVDLNEKIKINGRSSGKVQKRPRFDNLYSKYAEGGETIAGFPEDYHKLNMEFLKILIGIELRLITMEYILTTIMK